ncbi:MAG: DUF502 domain-containing protein [Desulfobacterota bacterium]|nr:DUF502 domain-containing protein [Thermodesulfobacteriota bacterium]
MSRLRIWLKNYLLTGLIVVVPITITVYIIQALIGVIDELLSVLPQRLHPDTLLGFHLPGLGLVLLGILILIVGVLTHNYAGRKLVGWWEALVRRIPIVRNIYLGLKQFTEAIFLNSGKHFQQVVMLEFPRPGFFSIGLSVGPARGELQGPGGERLWNVFVPCTPNPTTGYYVLVPEKELLVLKMSVEEAFKLIVSGGLIAPEHPGPCRRP